MPSKPQESLEVIDLMMSPTSSHVTGFKNSELRLYLIYLELFTTVILLVNDFTELMKN